MARNFTLISDEKFLTRLVHAVSLSMKLTQRIRIFSKTRRGHWEALEKAEGAQSRKWAWG